MSGFGRGGANAARSAASSIARPPYGGVDDLGQQNTIIRDRYIPEPSSTEVRGFGRPSTRFSDDFMSTSREEFERQQGGGRYQSGMPPSGGMRADNRSPQPVAPFRATDRSAYPEPRRHGRADQFADDSYDRRPVDANQRVRELSSSRPASVDQRSYQLPPYDRPYDDRSRNQNDDHSRYQNDDRSRYQNDDRFRQQSEERGRRQPNGYYSQSESNERYPIEDRVSASAHRRAVEPPPPLNRNVEDYDSRSRVLPSSASAPSNNYTVAYETRTHGNEFMDISRDDFNRENERNGVSRNGGRRYEDEERPLRNGGRHNIRQENRSYSEEFGSRHQPHFNDEFGYRPQEPRGVNKDNAMESRAPKNYAPISCDVNAVFDADRNNPGSGRLLQDDSDVRVEGSNGVVNMCERWSEFELCPQLLQNIERANYLVPRKIQAMTIPYILDGYDIKCQSETGSGKTAAFMIPIVNQIVQLKSEQSFPRGSPVALIISPTRELAQQLADQAQKFANNTGVTVAVAFGEYDVRLNMHAILQKGCDILIACVGRLYHFLNLNIVSLSSVRFLVMDEADRLMENEDMLFKKIMESSDLPSVHDRQTMLFSATLKDPHVMTLVERYLKANQQVTITADATSNKRITYCVFPVQNKVNKYSVLEHIIKATKTNGQYPRILVFVNARLLTDMVAMRISDAGIPTTTIHGDRGQHLREEALRTFHNGKTRVLVATDVCARGVDVKDLDYVINFDLPPDPKIFIQRCGRTGRIKNGMAISLYVPETDDFMAASIKQIISNNNQEVPHFLNDFEVSFADFQSYTNFKPFSKNDTHHNFHSTDVASQENYRPIPMERTLRQPPPPPPRCERSEGKADRLPLCDDSPPAETIGRLLPSESPEDSLPFGCDNGTVDRGKIPDLEIDNSWA